MKSLILALSVAVFAAGTLPSLAEAKRLGGGGSSGMQRSLPPRATPDATPARPAQPTQAAPATAGAATAAAAPKRSWMGPIAGLAAGLGIAALMSHLGFGAEFGNFIMLALLAVAAVFAIRFVMGRLRGAPRNLASANGLQYAGAAAGAPVSDRTSGSGWGGSASVSQPSVSVPAAASLASAPTVPVGFDQVGFERIAKMIFIRLQAANDSGDLNDLRQFTTPEMFASVKLDLQERGGVAQQTDVVQVDAQIVDFADEADRQVVSVRYNGQIREDVAGGVSSFDETWHLVKPRDNSREWAIAGIQQNH